MATTVSISLSDEDVAALSAAFPDWRKSHVDKFEDETSDILNDNGDVIGQETKKVLVEAGKTDAQFAELVIRSRIEGILEGAHSDAATFELRKLNAAPKEMLAAVKAARAKK